MRRLKEGLFLLLICARYSTDYGMFRFCIADTEHDWREGSEQYKFIEHCLASVDRQKQPWLIFLAHRVLGYSSTDYYANEGSFAEPMGRDDLQKLWQKYKVDIAFYGHVHSYERTCPVYQVSLIQSLIFPNILYLFWKRTRISVLDYEPSFAFLDETILIDVIFLRIT